MGWKGFHRWIRAGVLLLAACCASLVVALPAHAATQVRTLLLSETITPTSVRAT